MNNKIIAIVLTYADRKEFLEKCLKSLLSQTVLPEKILVFDNASSDRTKDFLEKYILHSDRILYYKNSENIASSAYSKALRMAFEKYPDAWFFLADDDSELEGDTLKHLVQSPYYKKQIAMLTAKRVDNEGNIEKTERGFFNFLKLDMNPLPVAEYEKSAVSVGVSSFMGMFINPEAIKKVGFPRDDYFLYWDDVEYCFRLRKYGEIILVPKSVIWHMEPRTARQNLKTRFGITRQRQTAEVFWRDYYGWRNLVFLAREHSFFLLTFFCFLFRLSRTLLAILVFDDQKLMRIRIVLRGFFDGMSNKTGKQEIFMEKS